MEPESNASRRLRRLSGTTGRGLVLLAAGLVVAGIAVAPRVAAGFAGASGEAVAAAGSLSDASTDVVGDAEAGALAEAAASADEDPVLLRFAPATEGPVDPAEALVVDIEVANRTGESLDASVLRLTAPDGAITDVDVLDAWLSAPAGQAVAEGQVRPISAGGTAGLSLTVPTEVLSVQAGAPVVAVGAELLVDGMVVATGGAVFPAIGATPAREVSVAMVASITIPPQTEGLADADQLANWTGPLGLLTRQLDSLTGRPVAIGIDPRIIVSIRVLGSDAPESAVSWLERLAAMPNEVFPLAYADADLALPSQLGVGVLAPGSFDDVLDPSRFEAGADGAGGGMPAAEAAAAAAAARASSASSASSTAGAAADDADDSDDSDASGGSAAPAPTETPEPTAPAEGDSSMPSTDELLAWPYTRTDLAWPADGTVAPGDLATFRAAGLTTSILSAANTEPDVHGNAASSLDGETALVADARITTALRSAAASPSDVALREASARVLAELALRAAEPGDPVALLTTFQRGASTNPMRVAATVDRLADSPSARVATLADVVGAPPVARALVDGTEPDPRRSQAQRMIAAEADVTAFATVLDDPSLLVAPVRRELLSLLDVSWLDQPETWNEAVGTWLAAQSSTVNSVSIVPSSPVNVLSTETGVPTTIENRLPFAATVIVDVAPSNGRLIVDEEVPVTVAPESRSNVRVPVEAGVGNGQVVLTVTLHSSAGVPIGRPVDISANVQADWEGLGAAILAVLVVAFFGFGLWRTIRRRRRTRAEDAAVPQSESGVDAPPAEPGVDAPPGEPGADAPSASPEETDAPTGMNSEPSRAVSAPNTDADALEPRDD